MLYFQEPGVAEKEFEADVRRAMRRFLFQASGDSTDSAALARAEEGRLGLLHRMPEAPRSCRHG